MFITYGAKLLNADLLRRRAFFLNHEGTSSRALLVIKRCRANGHVTRPTCVISCSFQKTERQLCLEVFALCSVSYVDRNQVSDVSGSLRSFEVSDLFVRSYLVDCEVYSLRLSRRFTIRSLYIASTWQLSAPQQDSLSPQSF